MAKNKISWSSYVIELLVVIIGISVAFALENYSKGIKSENEEKLYAEALKEDISEDIKHLQSIVDSSHVLIKYTGEIFQFVYSNAPSEKYTINHIVSTYTAPYFNSNNGTYISLINSGDLKILSDFKLRSAITDLYSVQYGEIERMDSFIQNLVTDLIYPYVLSEVTFSPGRGGIVDANPLKNNKAMNLFGSYFNFLTERIEIIEDVLAHCNEVKSLLDELE